MKKQPPNVRLSVYILLILILVLLSSKFIKIPHSTSKIEIKSQALSQIVNKDIDTTNGEWAIYIENLTTGEKYSKQQNIPFPSASLYKLFLLSAVFDQISKGNISTEDILSASKSYLIDRFGDTDFGYEDYSDTVSYTVQEALERVGRISDNFAAIMLADRIGWDKIQKAADSLGAKNTIIKDPLTTSAYDVSLFLKALYKGKIVSKQASATISGLLQLSNINDRIPAGISTQIDGSSANLPDGVVVTHKTGELSQVRHDAGIVTFKIKKGTQAYILVIMSRNLQYEDDAVAEEAKLSGDVFRYFSAK